MADSSADSDGNGGSWWGSWIQTAKEKSAGALEFVKKDLAEFTSTMQRDTGTAVKVTSSSLQETFKTENTEAAKDKMKQSINGFFDGLTKALTIPPEDKDTTSTRTQNMATTGAIYDRSKARLHAVQVDPDTYLKKPSGSPELFETWLETFNLDNKKGDISELLVVKVEVRALYTKLVPSEISHSDFWQRYFYKLHQLEQDEARKQALMKRAETPTEIDSLGWEDDWSGDEGEEFEKVTAGEVRAVRQDDVQSRLSPDPRHNTTGTETETGTGTGTACEENKTHAQTKNTSPKEQVSNIAQAANIDVDTRSGSSDSILTENVGTTLPKDAKCDISETSPVTKDPSETKSEEHSFDEHTPNDDEPEAPIPLNKNCNSAHAPEPKMPLTSKEADLLAAANSPKVESVKTVPEPSIPEHQGVCGDMESVEAKKIEGSSDGGGDKEIKTKVKGDLVMVGSDRESPTSDSSGYKDYLRLIPEPSVDDDWEQDFDVELTEEQKKAYEAHVQKLGDNLDSQDDDWESWE